PWVAQCAIPVPNRRGPSPGPCGRTARLCARQQRSLRPGLRSLARRHPYRSAACRSCLAYRPLWLVRFADLGLWLVNHAEVQLLLAWILAMKFTVTDE